MDAIQNSILNILRVSLLPLKAAELAKRITSRDGISIDKRRLNPCLYRLMALKIVERDSKYRWSMKSQINTYPTVNSTQFAKDKRSEVNTAGVTPSMKERHAKMPDESNPFQKGKTSKQFLSKLPPGTEFPLGAELPKNMGEFETELSSPPSPSVFDGMKVGGWTVFPFTVPKRKSKKKPPPPPPPAPVTTIETRCYRCKKRIGIGGIVQVNGTVLCLKCDASKHKYKPIVKG